ncbi:unnamed protein product [Nezara viridula]|uniref:Fork-head domain-containing protein n=1 Tax=Nezara viridula TaxID=85310 RepID=A0A9P0HGD5_NEZVI|nr:unnamed protein product [Nezara viridula]
MVSFSTSSVIKMAPERGESGPGEESTGVAPAHDPRSPIIYLKEGDGAVETAAIGRGEDDDLTSLTWLQDKNLLKGINLRTNGAGGKEESPTSDYAEECPSEQGESTCSSVTSSSPLPPPAKNRHPHHIPYDPKIHVTSKPPYSFSCLIFMSIEDSKGKALPVKEIYTWILDHFPYYRNAPTGWKNSVRHNLSLNKCFRKVDKAPNLGKGSLWMVDPVFRPNLVQALMKAPYHPYTNLDRNNSAPHFTRRSESSGSECEEDDIAPDDVDAAAAMLVLKHGPQAKFHISRDDYQRRNRQSNMKMGRHSRAVSRKEEEYPGRQADDHTYSSMESAVEPDEAFMDGSDSNSTCSLHIYEEEDREDPEEERRKTAEGADALLNLAGIKTGGLIAAASITLSPDRKRCAPARGGPPSKRKPASPHKLKVKR